MKSHQQVDWIKDSYSPHSTDGEFTLMVNSPVYKIKTTSHGYFRNTVTGENCGNRVELHIQLCDGLTILDEPIFEEDCYELVI